MISTLDLIHRVQLFATLNTAQAQMLAQSLTKRRYKRAENIVEQGSTSNAMYIILSGRARVVMADSQKREVILATLRVGDCIGEMSMIDSEAHSATVQAEVQTDVLVLGRDDFKRCLQDNASMAQAVMCGLVQRLRQANQKIGSLALMGVYGRVATALLDSATANSKGELLTHDKISRQDLAKMVGASREMVSRVMKDFEDQGFVQTLDDGSLRIIERRSTPR